MKRVESYSVSIGTALNGLTYAAGLVSFLSVVRYVGVAFSLAFALIFISAFYFDYRKRFAIPRTVLNIALVVFIVLNSLRVSLDDFATPVVETLLILISVKFLEEKKTRDYLQIYAVATFLLTGSALLTLDLQFLFNLVLLSFLLPLCVVMLTFYSEDCRMSLSNIELSRILSKALLIPLISIPVTALMFAILPRTGYPFLNFLNRGGANAGFTDNVKLGEVSNIQENASVILRVESDKIDEAMLYWRGIVLDYFNGTSWSSHGRKQENPRRLRISGGKVAQIVYLEPYGNKYLFALDKPLSIDFRGAEISGDLTTVVKRSVDRRIKYSAVSVLSDTVPQENIDKALYLQLPHMDLRRIEAIVHGLAPGMKDEARADAVLHYLRDGQFSYSLKNLPVSGNPLEDFLFRYKYGNCEYFASSMAVMLRVAGIPARLVGGYRGGYYNTIGGYYLVTQNNAHIWVEAYIGNGWIRMDPTPGSLGALAGGKQGLLLQARLFFDSLNYYWNAMIIGYDFNKQISLFIRLRNVIKQPSVDTAGLKKYATGGLLVLIAVAAVGAAIYFAIKKKTPEKMIIDRFTNIMERRGYKRSQSQGLREFAGGIGDSDLRARALRFVEGFEGLFYRDRRMTREDLARLKKLIGDL